MSRLRSKTARTAEDGEKLRIAPLLESAGTVFYRCNTNPILQMEEYMKFIKALTRYRTAHSPWWERIKDKVARRPTEEMIRDPRSRRGGLRL